MIIISCLALYVKHIASQRTDGMYNEFSKNPINEKFVLASSYFFKQESPVYINDATKTIYIVDTMFDKTVGKSIEILSTDSQILISLCCFFKPSYFGESSIIGAYASLSGKTVNISQISMTRFEGNGHTSFYLHKTLTFLTCLNQTNDFFEHYCGLCFMRSESNSIFTLTVNITSPSKKVCLEINGGSFVAEFFVLRSINIQNGSIINSLNEPSLVLRDCYLFDNTGNYDFNTKNIISERVYSDVDIPLLNSTIGIDSIAKRINCNNLPIFCRIGPRCSNLNQCITRRLKFLLCLMTTLCGRL